MIVNKQLAESNGHENKDKWRTPDWLFNKLDQEFGFTLDPCCEIESALCEKYFTPVENGLIRSWQNETVFVNPPYSRENIGIWVRKCYVESLKENTIVVALLPVSTSAKWWHEWVVNKCEVRFIERRVRFKNAPYTAPFSSVVVVYGSSGIKSFSQKIK
jgi:phage N-6-adenine-methyltransferase